MALTTTQAKSLEAKALASENKSEGMRMLLTEGYTVQDVRDLFEAPYGFVYGVARRAGLIDPTPREPKAETKPAKAAKAAPAKAPAAKAKPAAKAAPAKSTSKVAAAKATIEKAAPRARVARTARGK